MKKKLRKSLKKETPTEVAQDNESVDLTVTDQPPSSDVNTDNAVKETTAKPEPEKTVIKPTAEPLEKAKEESKSLVPARTGKTYYIIAGSFENQVNAERLVQQLKSKGYNAQIADTNKYGMYRVAFEGYGKLSEAKDKLYAIRNDENAEAWILKKIIPIHFTWQAKTN